MKTNSLLLKFSALSDAGLGIVLSAEQAAEISTEIKKALSDRVDLQTIHDLQTEIAILKDKQRKTLDRVIEIIKNTNTSTTENSGMGFPSYIEEIGAIIFKKDIVSKLVRLKNDTRT